MNLFSRVPGPIAWGMRIVAWTIGLAIIGVMLAGYGNFRLSKHILECMQAAKGSAPSALAYSQQLVACADKRSGPLERAVLYPRRKAMAALPNVPCRYVGVWTATRPPSARLPATVYRITLRDDSKFIAEPVQSPDTQVITGSWGVYQEAMVWFYDQGHVWPPDMNPIRHTNDDAFTLREAEGTLTSYALLTRAASQNCVPSSGKTVTAKAAAAPPPQAQPPAAPAGPPKMRPLDALSQAQRADYEQLLAGYAETFRIVARATACNHPDTGARMDALLKEIERRHGSDVPLVTPARTEPKPEPSIPCEAIAAQMASLQLPDLPPSLVLRPGEPIDRVGHTAETPTGPYQLVSRTQGGQGPVEYRVMHREKLAFSSAQPFEFQRLLSTPTPVLVLATRDSARQCAHGGPYMTWHAISLPSWGDAVVSPLDKADCMAVSPYTDASGRIGLCASPNSRGERASSHLYRVEDHGGVTFAEERRGACPG